MSDKPLKATERRDLMHALTSPHHPKTELEQFALREIQSLESENKRLKEFSLKILHLYDVAQSEVIVQTSSSLDEDFKAFEKEIDALKLELVTANKGDKG